MNREWFGFGEDLFEQRRLIFGERSVLRELMAAVFGTRENYEGERDS